MAKINADNKQDICGSWISKKKMEEKRKYWEDFFKKYEALSSCDNCLIPVSEITTDLEKELNQHLQEIHYTMLKRHESKILNDGLFDDWSVKLFRLMLHLKNKNIISYEEFQCYNRNYLSTRSISRIQRNIEKVKKSNLQNLLLKKYQLKTGTRNRALNKELKKEWIRLTNTMPLKDIVIYAKYILGSDK